MPHGKSLTSFTDKDFCKSLWMETSSFIIDKKDGKVSPRTKLGYLAKLPLCNYAPL